MYCIVLYSQIPNLPNVERRVQEKQLLIYSCCLVLFCEIQHHIWFHDSFKMHELEDNLFSVY